MADEEVVPNIIIKKVKKVAGGAHGGAWKVAYADFVTAMMAFFMLLWLLNVSEAETLAGLAQYFTPTTASLNQGSGSNAPLGGQAMDNEGGQTSGAIVETDIEATPVAVDEGGIDAKSRSPEAEEEALQEAIQKRETAMLESAADQIRLAIQESPELRQHQDQIIVDVTEDGLKVQIIDKDQRPMFRSGSDDLYQYAQRLIAQIGEIITTLPNRVSIAGHTDSGRAANATRIYSNWELSADRANAARRVFMDAGVTADRIADITGKAATIPMYPDNPTRPENRRISILLLREAPVLAPSFGRN